MKSACKILVTIGVLSFPHAATAAIKCPAGAELQKESFDWGKSESCAKGGVKHGPMVSFHKNGNKMGEGRYEDGKKEGLFTYWHANGKFKEKTTFKADVATEMTIYDQDGKLQAKGPMSGDAPSGTWVFFDDAGKKVSEGTFKEARTAYFKHKDEAEKKAQNDSAWTAGFFQRCFDEQIESAQNGKSLSQKWFPKSGKIFNADDQLYKIVGVISENPIKLLVEGPAAQLADSSLGNTCLAVLTLRSKSQLNVTQSPMPGYTIGIGDMIHGFQVKALGKMTVELKSTRSLASESKTLPEFELLGEIPMAQRP